MTRTEPAEALASLQRVNMPNVVSPSALAARRPCRTTSTRQPRRAMGRTALAGPIAASVAAVLGVPAAHATSDTWDGTTSNVWSVNTNWLGDPAVVPGTGDTATFNNGGN